jgi:hypothetical protein
MRHDCIPSLQTHLHDFIPHGAGDHFLLRQQREQVCVLLFQLPKPLWERNKVKTMTDDDDGKL